MAVTIKELADAAGVGEKTPVETDALLLEQADGLYAYCTIASLPIPSITNIEAEEVSADPHGAIEGETVQAQLEELETEKVGASHGHDVSSIVGGSDGFLMGWGDGDVGEAKSPSEYVNAAQVDAGEITAGTQTAIRSWSVVNVKSMAVLYGGGGGGGGTGGLAPEDNAGTAVTLNEGDFGKLYKFTSDSAIAITLDAQTGPQAGSQVIGIRKGGAGVVTVSMDTGAGYFVAGDDFGGTPATAAFTVSGFAYVEFDANSDGDSAVFIVGGETSLARTVAGNTTFTGTLTASAGVSLPADSIAIADTSGLQTALDAKLALAGGTLTGAILIPQVSDADGRTVADADSGKTLIYTGAGHTWTFNDANLTAGAHGVIRNAGSGVITCTTDGTEKFTGTEPIPVNKSACWEWDGTRLWLDVNG